jgi:predicted ester cyclase
MIVPPSFLKLFSRAPVVPDGPILSRIESVPDVIVHSIIIKTIAAFKINPNENSVHYPGSLNKQELKGKLMKKTLIAAVTVCLSAIMLAACEAEVSKDDGMSEALAAAEAKLAQMTTYDAEIAAGKEWIEIWDSGAVDKLDAIVHSDYTRTAPDVSLNGVDEMRAFMLQVHEAYPDYSLTNDGMAAGPDGVFVQWTVTGTDSGRGEESTGKPIRVTGMSRLQFSEGKLARETVVFDTGFAATQLGTDEMPHTED